LRRRIPLGTLTLLLNQKRVVGLAFASIVAIFH
jgi:hypothetical protein